MLLLPIQTHRNVDEPGWKQGNTIQPLFEALQDVFETHELARCRRWVVDTQSANLLRCVGVFKICECRIDNAKLFHCAIFGRRWSGKLFALLIHTF